MDKLERSFSGFSGNFDQIKNSTYKLCKRKNSTILNSIEPTLLRTLMPFQREGVR